MKQGEIYLVNFPFTDLTSTKLRPAMIISNDSFNIYGNCMFIGIFGNGGNKNYSKELQNSDLLEGRLNKKSYFRFHNTFSLHKNLIIKKVGVLKTQELKEVSERVQGFLKVKN